MSSILKCHGMTWNEMPSYNYRSTPLCGKLIGKNKKHNSSSHPSSRRKIIHIAVATRMRIHIASLCVSERRVYETRSELQGESEDCRSSVAWRRYTEENETWWINDDPPRKKKQHSSGWRVSPSTESESDVQTMSPATTIKEKGGTHVETEQSCL